MLLAPHPPNPDTAPRRMGGPNCVYKKYRPGARTKSLSSSTISGTVILSTSAKSRKVQRRAKTPNRRSGRAPSISSAPHRRAMLEAAARSSNQRDQSRHHRKRAHCGVISSAQPATCLPTSQQMRSERCRQLQSSSSIRKETHASRRSRSKRCAAASLARSGTSRFVSHYYL